LNHGREYARHQEWNDGESNRIEPQRSGWLDPPGKRLGCRAVERAGDDTGAQPDGQAHQNPVGVVHVIIRLEESEAG
jgi:hypothetical protein